MSIRITIGLVAGLLFASAALADDFAPDDLCRAIGETKVIALQPRDRLYLEKNCECVGTLGCAAKGTPRAGQLREQLARAQEAQKRAAEQQVADKRAAADRKRQKRARANAATAALRKALEACKADPARMDCRTELVTLQDACDATRAYADLQDCIEAP